jgi:hypothetical protein
MSSGGPPDAPNRPAPGAANPYAPPAAAIDVAAIPAQAAGGFKSATPLANAIMIIMAVEVLGQLADMGNALLTISVMHRVVGGEEVARDTLVAIDNRAQALSVLELLTLVAAAVAYCLFMPRANRNASSFGALLKNTPGWAAGWFFVPFASLWKPYEAMKEIWQASDPDPAKPAAFAAVPSLLPWWWGMFLVHNIGGWIFAQLSKGSPGPGGLITLSWAQVVTGALTICAALLAVAVVRQLARRQDERQRRQLAGPPAAPAT